MSNLGGFLFGNIDDSGRLEGDVDDELRETFEKMGDGSLAPLLGNIFNLDIDEQNDDDDDDDAKKISKARSIQEGAILPSASAIDYTDFEELAKEEIKEKKQAAYNKNAESLFSRSMVKKTLLSDEDDNYDDEEPPQPPPIQPISITNNQTKPAEPIKVDIKKLYPTFEKNAILKFSSLFMKPPEKKFKSGHNIKKIDLNTFKVPEPSSSMDSKNLLSDPNYSPKTKPQSILDKLCPPSITQKKATISVPEISEPEPIAVNEFPPDVYIPNNQYLVDWENWEDNIIWDADAQREPSRKQADKPLLGRLLKYQNNELEEGDWDQRIVWDCDTESANKMVYPLTMDLNDTNMLFDIIVKKDDRGSNSKNSDFDSRGVKLLKKAKKMGGNRDLNFIGDIDYAAEELDRYNLSNDLYYEATKDVKNQRVRQTFGMLMVQHSLPALQLHPSFFKTRLTKVDLRNFHRPKIHFPLNTQITFSKIRTFKKKKGKKAKDELMSSCKDLTLKDNTNIVLIEYSEQFPPILSNPGMGSILVNYYRKKSGNDQYVPESDYGEPIILDMADATPFLNFGDVEAGETISGLYNGLIRAPLFRHKPKTNDFLLVKHTFKNKIKYYLRNIPVIYVSGQTYPITEVPGPHSRKITSTIKNRLQVAAFRLIKKSPFHRLDISSLVKRFPEYSEPQIRQRLKEFTEFHRKGSNSGHWSLKPTIELPDEEKLRQMLTPETICLYESMLAGQRHLQDSGYGRSVEDDDNEESMSKLDIEEQLAPWITTRNFVNASQGKAMLRLYGEGDPTARGEGFNLIRVSMKDIFLREGESAEEKLAEIEARPKSAHRYNVAEQQQIYREEITRIWNAQKNSLSSEAEVDLSESDSDDQIEKEFDYYNRKSNALMPNQTNSPSVGMSDKHLLDDDDDISVTGSILSRVSTKHKNKVLTIKRRIRDASGNLVWKSQTVKNTAVIQAYLRNRRIIEDSIARETTQPTTEVERQQLMQKRLRERLDMLKSSTVARSDLDPNTKKASAGGTIPTHLPNKPRKELIRRCGNCGQLGHMKTNRKCPMFKEMNGGGSSPGVSTPESARNQQDRPASQDPNPHGSNVPSKLRINAFSANEESNEDYDTN